MIKLIVIDFDDTLCLTEEACFNIENHIAGKMGFSPMTRESHLKNWGAPVEKAIVERIPGIDPDLFMVELMQVLPEFIERGEIDCISEQNIETLRKLKQANKHLAILTSRTFNEVRHIVDENHHLHDYIENIYHKDNMEFHKPDPRAFNAVFDDFSVAPTETLYIGDSVSDGISAKGAGIHFIALLESGLRKKSDFDAVDVDFFAQTFPEVLEYIEKN